jgi:hypothetical protein
VLSRVFFFAVFIILRTAIAHAQPVARTITAAKISGPITIDGKLEESGWQGGDKATSFTQYAPVPGAPSLQRSEVSIRYDDEAVYIGAMLYDSSPDSILKQLSSRDDDGGNADEFQVTLDTYHDHQNAFLFGVTAAGVQVDGIIKFDAYNTSWNAAWYSKVTINEKGWCVEMKIPYSAIRFPDKPQHEWGINFFRSVRRYREKSFWNQVLPTIANVISQSGVMTGINDIESPIRLSLLPYLSGYAENYAGANSHAFNGGLDIKYGINESFTLDMTLVPDFGKRFTTPGCLRLWKYAMMTGGIFLLKA